MDYSTCIEEELIIGRHRQTFYVPSAIPKSEQIMF